MNTEDLTKGQPEGLITEAEAAELLGISVLTLRNKIYKDEIPKDFYITLLNGKRRYYRSRILSDQKPS